MIWLALVAYVVIGGLWLSAAGGYEWVDEDGNRRRNEWYPLHRYEDRDWRILVWALWVGVGLVLMPLALVVRLTAPTHRINM